MKSIQAYVRPDRAAKVLDRLAEIGMEHAAITPVKSVGSASADPATAKVSFEYGRPASAMVKIEFFAPDRFAQMCVKLICDGACTHHPGDGVVTVWDAEAMVRIRTGEPINEDR